MQKVALFIIADKEKAIQHFLEKLTVVENRAKHNYIYQHEKTFSKILFRQMAHSMKMTTINNTQLFKM